MNKTKIEYLTHTWNPLAMRCTPISPGCQNCWHLRWAKRHSFNPSFSDRLRSAYSEGVPVLKNTMQAPFRGPARIGVQFMGDIFHPSVKDEDILFVSNVMLNSPGATFFLLTKRPKRAQEWFSACPGYVTPPDNIWVGVSVENQETADERIPLLLETPSAHRWVSVEPVLGPVDLQKSWRESPLSPESVKLNWLTMGAEIHWVVCGAETGPGKRPCNPKWIDSLREQCVLAKVPFFGKVDQDGKAIIPRQMPA